MLTYRNDGDRWEWNYKDADWYWCTNNYGEGIFVVNSEKNTRRQILGTCEFSLKGLKDPKGKIRRFMKK